MDRRRVSTGTEWERTVGYSRAVRVGDRVEVSGTTATDEEGAVVGVGDARAQTERAIENVERGLREAGASRADVVRTRVYVTDIDRWEAVGRAHGAAFGDVRLEITSGGSLTRPNMDHRSDIDGQARPASMHNFVQHNGGNLTANIFFQSRGAVARIFNNGTRISFTYLGPTA